MVLYKKKSSPVLRYLFAFIVFALGLTLTVVDVYGLQLPFGQNAGDSYTNYLDKKVETTDDTARDFDDIDIQTDYNDTQDPNTDTMPTSVPEPSTIILLASGLGLLKMAHRKNK